MANTFNSDATSYVREVARVHGAVVDFINFIEATQASIGTDYSNALKLPSRIRTLVLQKASFDALGIPSDTVKAILEKNHGYTDWTATHSSDFEAIFTNAEVLRTAVESNLDLFPPSWDGTGNIVYETASEPVQTALSSAIDDILASVA